MGRPWKITIEEAIDHIRKGTFIFYVSENREEVDVSVIEGKPPQKDYLRTEPDETAINNLENLMEWPSSLDERAATVYHLIPR